MDLKNIIARIAADCDQRNKFVRNFPDMFDRYYLTRTGELVTEEELKRIASFTFLLDGLDFVSGQLVRA